MNSYMHGIIERPPLTSYVYWLRKTSPFELSRVLPEMVDFGSGQGPSAFCNRRHSVAIPRIAEKREHSPGPKDAVCGWILTREHFNHLIRL